jgi:glycosyltransferase involved in cell wall biosynthesis
MKPIHIFLVANISWYLTHFRLSLMRHWRQKGFKITAVAMGEEEAATFSREKIAFLPIRLDRKGLNPLRDLFLIFKIIFIYLKNRPDLIFHFTVKPNVYGGIASTLLSLNFVNNVTGLGSSFLKHNFITKVVMFLYRIACRKAQAVVFQNTEDWRFFTANKIVTDQQAVLIPGSGVDTKFFSPEAFSPDQGKEFTSFIMISRLIVDKGVLEYVQAAKIVKKKYPHITFVLVGGSDSGNPSAIEEALLQTWIKEKIVHFTGNLDDVRKMLGQSDCSVLPSYREGLSRTLLESASMARPLIATDVAGCRELVIEGVTGFLCQPKSADDLAAKMTKMIELSYPERITMGQSARNLVIQKFSNEVVINEYDKLIQKILKSKGLLRPD